MTTARPNACGPRREEWAALGDALADGDWTTVEQAGRPTRPVLRERFEVWPDGSVWLRPSPFSAWRGPLVAIRCDGSEVP